MILIDTHCHLDFDVFNNDREDVIDRAAKHGVSKIILVGIDQNSWRVTESMAAQNPIFARTAGLHPNSVADQWEPDTERALRDEAMTGNLVGIGETGVDLFRSRSSRTAQMESFERHIEIALEASLPVIVHQREAEEEVLEVLGGFRSVSGIMHCFGGNWDFAQHCLDIGLHLGIGGVATFKRSTSVRDAIARAPIERLVLETDAPFLAPQAKRGSRNEPSFLRHIVKTIATCRTTSPEEIAEETTANAIRLFGLTL